MTGPWEKFANLDEGGPWSKFRPSEPPRPDYGDSTQGTLDYVRDLVRTQAQGAYVGLGDEAAAVARTMAEPAITGVKYWAGELTGGRIGGLSKEEQEELDRLDTPSKRAAFLSERYNANLAEEREGIARFREKNPWTAFASEVAGGAALPVGKLLNAPTLVGKTVRSAGVGGGYAGAYGFGSGEGGFQNRVGRGAEFAPWGVAGGAAVPPILAMGRGLLKGTSSIATQATDDQAAARLYFADRLRRSGTDEAALADDLARGQDAARFGKNARAELPETIADLTPANQRVLRGIKVGGDADDIIEPFLGKRQGGTIDFSKGADAGGQYGRLTNDLKLALKTGEQPLSDKISGLTARRKKIADKLFSAARAKSEPFDLSGTLTRYKFEAMQLADPAQRATLNRAVEAFTQSGNYGNYRNVQFPVIDVNRFHLAKQFLDDLLGTADVRSQGNLKRLLTMMKHDVLDDLLKPNAKGKPTINAAYRKALDTYSSQSELLAAADLGKAFANGAEEITPRMWRSLSEGEKGMVRRAWTQGMKTKMGGKAAGPTADYTHALRTPNAGDDLRMILPPSAGKAPAFPGGNRERLTELVRREHRMSTTSSRVQGNSTTAEKTVDAIDAGRMVHSLRYIKEQGGFVNAAINGLSDVIERLSAIKGRRARYLAQKLLSTDPSEQQQFLREVERAYGASVTRKIVTAAERARQRLTPAMAIGAASLGNDDAAR